MTPNEWLFQEISYVRAVDLVRKVTTALDDALSVEFQFSDHVTVSSDLTACQGNYACEVSSFYGDYPRHSVISLPNPVHRYVILHELSHSIAHFVYGRSAQHGIDWLRVQIKLLFDIGAIDAQERCPWFSKAELEIPICQALGF